jgi:hypothetical protein
MNAIGTVAALGLVALGLQPVSAAEPVTFDSAYTYRMLDPTTDINRKQVLLLQWRDSGRLDDGHLLLGADIQAIGDAHGSNTTGKFGYLMRHPTQSNHSGKTASELVIHSAGIQITGTANSWTTLYPQILYNPEQSFGSGTITGLQRNQLSLRRGYVLLGDLSLLPIYASIGKMATPFGLTDTVNPFSASTVWHAFGGLAYGGTVGVHQSGIDLSAMAIQGGSQFRATHSGDDTPDDIANFAVTGAYTADIGDDASFRVGGSYLHGSAYCQEWPVMHFEPCDGFNNPAWGAHGVLTWGSLKVIGEYAETTEEWPGTHNPHPPLDVFSASKVSAFDIGAKFAVPIDAIGRDLSFSADFSEFKAGAEDSPWERQSQLVIGFEVFWNAHTKMFAEYVHTEGYVPLNFISGPDPFDATENPGTTHSMPDATSDVGVIGFRVAI